MKTYKAPWSISLIIVSALFSVVLVGAAVHQLALHGRVWPALLTIAILVGGLLFVVRGYTITPDALLVHRLLWSTRVPLAQFESAESAPDIMRGGLRVFGNGGLFSFTGLFRNRALGTYRAFVTDPHRTVVLRFRSRPVVVSPAAPDEFVHAIRAPHQAA